VPSAYTRLDGRDAVVAAAGGQPYARYSAVGEVTGYRSDAAVVWRLARGSGVSVGGLGVQEDGELIAAAADRSRGGVGYIAGVAVHPAHRKRGLGSAVTAVLTGVLLDEFGAVGLGVMADAVATRRIYVRLGYGEHLLRTSLPASR
jgi:ribosomal protein S18 acetylase RimI-like enzyme